MADDRHDWHKTFAVEAFNASWDLLDLPTLTPAEEDKLLWLVFASRWHWDVVGQDEQRWMGDHQIATACSRLGLADLAVRFAGSALGRLLAMGGSGWRLASAHEGMARAHATAGDAERRERHMDLAWEALDGERDPEDRAAIEAQLATVPEV